MITQILFFLFLKLCFDPHVPNGNTLSLDNFVKQGKILNVVVGEYSAT